MTEREYASGRRRYRSRRETEKLAADFAASGLTQQELCERHDVSPSALARYVKRYRKRAAAAPPPWVPEPFSLVRKGSLERPGAVKGAPLLGAAKRTLDGEDRSGTMRKEGEARRTIGETCG